jgi:hypothetical protein
LEKVLPLRRHLKPGQIVWNVVRVSTRADRPNAEYVPVVLTMINQKEIEDECTHVQVV